jgi:hypothetical protein
MGSNAFDPLTLNEDERFVFWLQSDKQLNPGTLVPENFNVFQEELQASFEVKDVIYYPSTGEVELVLSEQLSMLPLMYNISAENIYGLDGEHISQLSGESCVVIEKKGTENSLLITSASFFNEGAPVYRPGGTVTACIRVANSTSKDVKAFIKIYSSGHTLLTQRSVDVPSAGQSVVSLPVKHEGDIKIILETAG